MGEFRDDLVRELELRGKVKRNGSFVYFRCVRHDDSKPSAWLGDGAWGCRTCGFEEPIGTLADELGIERPKVGYSLEDYADEKAFSASSLRSWGVDTAEVNGRIAVAIEYRDAGGKVLRRKFRSRHPSKQKAQSWWEGKDLPIHPYGLDVLAKSDPKRHVILVEGESDCHAAWTHDILAVGIPGASAWKSSWKTYLEGRTVFIWREHGDAGAKFVESIARDLPGARVLSSETFDDLADMHKSNPEDFRKQLAKIVECATSLDVPPPPVVFDRLRGGYLDELIARKKLPVDAVPTPFPTLNSACRDEGGSVGFARGWHATIGAKTGAGKSLLGLNVTDSAIQAGERVAFVSLEMSQAQLSTRLMAIHSGISVSRLEKGEYFCEGDAGSAATYLNEVYERTGGEVLVNRRPISRLSDVASSIRYQMEYNGARFFVIDYLQLATVESARSRVEAIQEISHTVRGLATELEVITLGLSQFNRLTSTDRDRPPTPQGMEGGSALENDSDLVLLVDHTSFERHGNYATQDLLLAKNRHGPQVRIPLRLDFRNLRITECVDSESNHRPEPRKAAQAGPDLFNAPPVETSK